MTARYADATRARLDDLRSAEVVLQPPPRFGLELRVAHDDPGAIDQRDAVAEGLAGAMRQLVRIRLRVPLGGDHPAHAGELVALLFDEAIAQPPAGDHHHGRHE